MFGEEYERYRRCVPALFPYKGAGGKCHLEDFSVLEANLSTDH
jgi:hypothetical protein